MNYYISDLHFNHDNIRKLCNRPFKTCDDMNDAMIKNWNSRVGVKDTVYILGDFGFGEPARLVAILKKLNGHKCLVRGNHDQFLKKLSSAELKLFTSISDSLVVKENGHTIFCNHYPHAEWNGYWNGVLHFYGHIHNSQNLTSQLMSQIPNAYNVSADVLGFTPRTLQEIVEMQQH